MTRDLVPAFVKLLKDSEAEVRTAIAGQIPGDPVSVEGNFNALLTLSEVSVDCSIEKPFLTKL